MIRKEPISVYVQFDEGGYLTQRHVVRGHLPRPWVKLTREANEATMANPMAFLYHKDGSVTPLKRCEMVISTTQFQIDTDDFSVSIRGDEVPEDALVKVSVNDEIYEIPKDDHIEFTAEEPGTFVVRLADERFYTSPIEVVVFGIRGSNDDIEEDEE